MTIYTVAINFFNFITTVSQTPGIALAVFSSGDDLLACRVLSKHGTSCGVGGSSCCHMLIAVFPFLWKPNEIISQHNHRLWRNLHFTVTVYYSIICWSHFKGCFSPSACEIWFDLQKFDLCASSQEYIVPKAGDICTFDLIVFPDKLERQKPR